MVHISISLYIATRAHLQWNEMREGYIDTNISGNEHKHSLFAYTIIYGVCFQHTLTHIQALTLSFFYRKWMWMKASDKITKQTKYMCNIKLNWERILWWWWWCTWKCILYSLNVNLYNLCYLMNSFLLKYNALSLSI